MSLDLIMLNWDDFMDHNAVYILLHLLLRNLGTSFFIGWITYQLLNECKCFFMINTIFYHLLLTHLSFIKPFFFPGQLRGRFVAGVQGLGYWLLAILFFKMFPAPELEKQIEILSRLGSLRFNLAVLWSYGVGACFGYWKTWICD